MEAVLGERDVLLNVVVWAEYKLRESPDAVVLGVDYSGLSYVLEPGGRFSVNSGPLEIIDVSRENLTTMPAFYIDCTVGFREYEFHKSKLRFLIPLLTS